VRPNAGLMVRGGHLLCIRRRATTSSEVNQKCSFLVRGTTTRACTARRVAIGPAVALVARRRSRRVLSDLRMGEIGGSSTLMRWLYTRLICRVSMAVSVPTISGRDKAWAHRKRRVCQSVDVGRTATVPSMVVALRARPRRGRLGDILLARLRLRLRLQAIAKDGVGVVVVGRRVVEGGFEGAKLGDGGRQRLDMGGGRSRGATRPHVSFGALEAAIMRRLREHGLFAAVVRFAAAGGVCSAVDGAPAPRWRAANRDSWSMRFRRRAVCEAHVKGETGVSEW
jgi:hypothetical protein